MEHRYTYEAIVEPDEGGLYIWFPDVPDAFTQAQDMVQAAVNAADTLDLALADYIEDGITPPPATFGHDHEPGDCLLVVTTVVTDELLRDMASVPSSEAAKMLGVSNGRITQLVSSGQLDSYGSGTARRITLNSINARISTPRPAGRPRKELATA